MKTFLYAFFEAFLANDLAFLTETLPPVYLFEDFFTNFLEALFNFLI